MQNVPVRGKSPSLYTSVSDIKLHSSRIMSDRLFGGEYELRLSGTGLDFRIFTGSLGMPRSHKGSALWVRHHNSSGGFRMTREFAVNGILEGL